MRPARVFQIFGLALVGLGLAFSCGSDDSLREYLDARFWLPFSKRAAYFERKNVRRVSAAYAGMTAATGDAPLERLRAAYQQIPQPDRSPTGQPPGPAKLHQALAAAEADRSLTSREREEVELLDAKIDMRLGEPEGSPDELLLSAENKLLAFLRSARTPEFRSEARGWLAHIYYLFGEQTRSGKIYLDELNRNGSNLSRKTLLDSLELTYGYDGGDGLIEHLDEYFDTPEHAAFAIQVATNPHWRRWENTKQRADEAQNYARIKGLLGKHANLFASKRGSSALALLGMRTALRMGDPPVALEIAAMVPGNAEGRKDPDFLWMLASAHFLSHDFSGAEASLLQMFQSPRASANQKAAAAYGLCGVYWKSKNFVEGIRFALWLRAGYPKNRELLSEPGSIADQSIYWAESGWDLGLLLDAEAPDEALQSVIKQYPAAAGVELVRCALAVRLARKNQYEEAAQVYESIQADRRAARMRQLTALYRESNRKDRAPAETQEAKYQLAEYIGNNPERIYFNDRLWHRMQAYALTASRDSRLTRDERQALIEGERTLKDEQEERWRAYLILRGVVQDEGDLVLRRKSALLAMRYLRHISDRFGRNDEIAAAENELTQWMRRR